MPVPKISGTLAVTSTGDVTTTDGQNCAGTNGFSDIDSGTGVTLTNESGIILATSQLSTGRASVAPGGIGLTCTFSFTFGNVSAPAKFYSVEVAHRGKITDSAADLKAAHYRFAVTLGP